MSEGLVETVAASASQDGAFERTLLSETGAEVPGLEAGRDSTGFERGDLIGRYVALSRLGAGAMGVVLAAYDPQLDRKVAVKLLEPSRGEREAARVRLQREGQALAKLDHPNVVRVHDVGIHGGRLFVAMEFVAGQTLGAWMRSAEAPRPWPEVLAVFMAAGRGLAAAHAAGLVHRDFKPDNVMIGDDGRVRVMDFGLARTQAGQDDDTEPTRGEAESGDAAELVDTETSAGVLDEPLTQTGALLGTPAYMAPEQFAGQPGDARSDQFGFCVALYEALYGERPFASGSLVELIAALSEGQVREPPSDSAVPAWIRKVVVRGLAAAPDHRYPSVQVLLAALADDPSKRRALLVRRLGLGVGVAAALAFGVFGLTRAPIPQPRTCVGFDDKLAGLWDEARRAEVRGAIEATGSSYASDTWIRVERGLDAYASAWVAARVVACEASERGEQSGELLDLRMACLDARLVGFGAAVEVLADADETVVKKATTVVSSLAGLERCADAEALRAAVPPPDDPNTAAEVAAVDQRLAAAAALAHAGKYERGAELAELALVEAETLGYAPLLARAHLQQGRLRAELVDYPGAEAALVEAYRLALGERMLEVAAEASAHLINVVGLRLARYDDAARWVLDAGALAEAVGTDEARGNVLRNRGTLAREQGEFDAALRDTQAALEALERALGPTHLTVGKTWSELGIALREKGRLDEARDHAERALAIFEEAYGPNHPNVGAALNNLGAVADQLGARADARAYYERALAIFEGALGPEHPHVAAIAYNLGVMAKDEGRLAEARPLYERALAIWLATSGPEHPDVGYGHMNLGMLELELGRHAEARAHLERSLEIWETTLGPKHPRLAFPLTGLAEVHRVEGEVEAALLLYERAYELRRAGAVEAGHLAESKLDLARALWDVPAGRGRDRSRARRLVEEARATLVGLEGWPKARAAAEEWLATH